MVFIAPCFRQLVAAPARALGHPMRDGSSTGDAPMGAVGKFNRSYWDGDYGDFVEWFARASFTEPHSTKQIEDAVAWALETDRRRSP